MESFAKRQSQQSVDSRYAAKKENQCVDEYDFRKEPRNSAQHDCWLSSTDKGSGMPQSMNEADKKTRRLWKEQLLTEQDGKCAICLMPMGKDVTFDHIQAKAQGGKTELPNLQLAHYRCNEIKGTEMNRDMQKKGLVNYAN